MKSFKSKLIEARKARVPLGRVSIELKRSDKQIKRKAALLGTVLTLTFILVGSVAFYKISLGQFLRDFQDAAIPSSSASVSIPEENLVSLTHGQNHFPKPSATLDNNIPTIEAQEVAALVLPAPEPDATRKAAAEPETEITVSTSSKAPAIPETPIVRLQVAALQSMETARSLEILKSEEDSSCTRQIKDLASRATVYFSIASVTVPNENVAALKDLATAAAKCPLIKIDVGGHTDKSGEQLLNLQLSWQRAENVIRYLNLLGLNTSQFSPVGYSATRPLVNADNIATQAKNRRVEFIIR